jgi:hypothetical protein
MTTLHANVSGPTPPRPPLLSVLLLIPNALIADLRSDWTLMREHFNLPAFSWALLILVVVFVLVNLIALI